MYLKYCTITGIDEKTDLERVRSLSNDYPFVEWGFLFSPTKQGKHPRYPSETYIASKSFYLAHLNLALHLCGKSISEVLDQKLTIPTYFNRIQLNFNNARTPINISALQDLIITYKNINFITPHNKSNDELWRDLISFDNHQLLWDSSGGRGKFSTEIPHFIDGKLCGYAGGINPDNIVNVLRFLDYNIRGITWIDMESGVRDENDYLDLDKVENILEKVAPFAII